MPRYRHFSLLLSTSGGGCIVSAHWVLGGVASIDITGQHYALLSFPPTSLPYKSLSFCKQDSLCLSCESQLVFLVNLSNSRSVFRLIQNLLRNVVAHHRYFIYDVVLFLFLLTFAFVYYHISIILFLYLFI